MLCRYERKAIVTPPKDKTKAKIKGKDVSAAKGAGVAAGAPKSTRGKMSDQEGALDGSPHPPKSTAGKEKGPTGGHKSSKSAGGDDPETTEDTASSDDGAETEESDEEIVEADAEVVEEDVKVDDVPKPAAARGGGGLARLDPMQQYLREVQRHPLLTPQEEHDLAVKYVGSGDVAAAARLVTANLRLVVKLAYEYRRAYKNIMDLVQEGNIGLMQAVKRYDPYRGVKLSSYAAWWIRAYILRFILNNWRLVKLGTTQAQRKLFFN